MIHKLISVLPDRVKNLLLFTGPDKNGEYGFTWLGHWHFVQRWVQK